MPPRPAGTSRKNHSGNRHDNGLVFPGKKISKQKSNGHLNNGNPNGQQLVRSLSSRNSSEQLSMTGNVAKNGGVNGTAHGNKMEANAQTQGNGSGRADSNAPNGPSVPNGAAPGGRLEDHACRLTQSTQNPKKAANSRSVNPFLLASTILKSCPMSDTIAILIFLLQLPPIVLTLVQFLYASMTFMLPAGMSTGTLTSNFDIFQGPAGTPSLGTMIAMDGFCLLVWGLFMWNWAQNFAIDLAHVQVAIALGAGSSGDAGSVNAFCVTVVLIVHLLRSEGVQNFVVGHLLSYKLISAEMVSKISSLIPAEFRRKEAPSSPSWIRSVLAVHILAQAATAMARRSMAKNRTPPRAKNGKRADTEAFAGSQSHVDSSALDSATNLSQTGTPEGHSHGSLSLKDGRERISSAKKRRRQANEARRLQPFWAALASTKLTVTREYERSRNGHWYTTSLPIAEDDVDGASLDDGLIWITDIDTSSIKFAASDFSPLDDSVGSNMYDSSFAEAEPEPFYVRVNGAQWAPVTLRKIPESANEGPLVHWRGVISGLAPDCAYTCSFVRTDTNEEICVMSVKTPPAPDAEQVAPSVSPSPRPSLRPSSPTTTIKNSIANAEAKLQERRARLKKTKADHKLNVSKIKKELDNFTHRLNSGGDESRQKQRSLQLERTIRQTEEATAVIETQLDNLEKIPEEEIQEWKSRKAEYEQELENVRNLKEELDAARLSTHRSISSLEAELLSVVQKKERLQGRRTRLTEQYERITAANNQGLNERERRAAEQLAKEREHARIEGAFYEQLTNITKSVQDLQLRTTQLSQQASAIEQIYQQQQLQLMTSGPLTPEGELPGTNPYPFESVTPSMAMTTTGAEGRPSLGSSFIPFTATDNMGYQPTSMSPIVPSMTTLDIDQQQYTSSPLPASSSLFAPAIRGRSLSNFSGRSFDYNIPFSMGESHDTAPQTVSSDAGQNAVVTPTPIGHGLAQFNRAGSRGSGSGSGSGSGGGSGSGSPHSGKLAKC
ncbi:hypothetical protein VTO42DRAFT_5059 [Malbranchea cinnamomea]